MIIHEGSLEESYCYVIFNDSDYATERLEDYGIEYS